MCTSSMGHLGIGLLRGDADFAYPRLLAGCVRGMPVNWEALGVWCSLQAGALTGTHAISGLISSSSTYHICACTLEAMGQPLWLFSPAALEAFVQIKIRIMWRRQIQVGNHTYLLLSIFLMWPFKKSGLRFGNASTMNLGNPQGFEKAQVLRKNASSSLKEWGMKIINTETHWTQ